MSEIPQSLQGLRVRLISSPIETPKHRRARQELKELLDTHGKHMPKKALALFRHSLNGLLLHGLRARLVKSTESDSDYSSAIRFRGSDQNIYIARDAKAWAQVQKKDPRSKDAQFGK